ncbi:hypothetical protein HDE77_001007 [Rhodanobacter sp. MP7CTX1]|nr:hypothetical protein [Rhodanobacter sp. MP7CTX1]
MGDWSAVLRLGVNHLWEITESLDLSEKSRASLGVNRSISSTKNTKRLPTARKDPAAFFFTLGTP